MKLPHNVNRRFRAIMAYEEAAHAVVARKLGIEVLYIAMFPTGADSAGEARRAPAAHHVARDADAATTIGAYEKDAKIALAGPMAHGRVDQRSFKRVRDVSDPDIVKAMRTAGHIAMLHAGQPVSLAPGERMQLAEAYREEIAATFERLWDDAAALVVEHWPAIERLAAVLVERDYLDPTELDRIIGV